MIHWPALLASPQVTNRLFCKWRPQSISVHLLGRSPSSLRCFVCSRARGDIRHTERNFRAKSWVYPSLNAQSTVGPSNNWKAHSCVSHSLVLCMLCMRWSFVFSILLLLSFSLSLQCLSDVVSTLYGTKFRTWVVITQIGNFTLPKFGIG